MTLKPNVPVIRIGVAADILGVSPELLRLYEKEGLVIPHKTPSGHRLFSEYDIEWMACIREQIKNNKMNLAGIRMVIDLASCGALNASCIKKDCKNCKAYQNFMTKAQQYAENMAEQNK